MGPYLVCEACIFVDSGKYDEDVNIEMQINANTSQEFSLEVSSQKK